MEKNSTDKFIEAILNKKNVTALKQLEKILKQKVAKRISDTLKDD